MLQQEVRDKQEALNFVDKLEKLNQLPLIKKNFDYQPNVHIKFDQTVKKLANMFHFELLKIRNEEDGKEDRQKGRKNYVEDEKRGIYGKRDRLNKNRLMKTSSA